MNGISEYENKILNRINKIIKENDKYKCLQSYVNSISGRRSYSTQYAYLCTVVRFLNYSGVNPDKLLYEHYINYLASVRQYSSTFQITVYAALKKLSEFLYAADICSKNYMLDIEMPKYVDTIEAKEKRENGYLTKQEIVEYINNVKNANAQSHRAMARRENSVNRDLAIVMLFLTTGMRCSALYKLDINNIDLINQVLVTIDKEQKIEEHYLSDEVCSILSDWLNDRKLILYGANKHSDALFLSNRLERISQNAISAIVNKYSFTINGKHITPHKLRATYGTQIYENTHDLYTVQQCMGHASPITSERYIRGQKNSSRKNAADIMTNLLY